MSYYKKQILVSPLPKTKENKVKNKSKQILKKKWGTKVTDKRSLNINLSVDAHYLIFKFQISCAKLIYFITKRKK